MKCFLEPSDLDEIRARLDALEAEITLPPVDPPIIIPPIEPPIVLPPVDSNPTPDPDDTPEDLESGVLFDRPFRTQAQINQFHAVANMDYMAGDYRAGKYDPVIDGARMPIIAGEKMPMLRNHNLRVEAGIVLPLHISYEWYVPQSLFDLPWDNLPWSSMKTFRFYNHAKRQFTELNNTRTETGGTVNFTPRINRVTLREVGTIDPDVSSDENIRLDWGPEPDKWQVMHFIWDYQNKQITIDLPGLHRVVGVTRMQPLDDATPILHSTSRGHKGSGDHPETYLGYRNVRMWTE